MCGVGEYRRDAGEPCRVGIQQCGSAARRVTTQDDVLQVQQALLLDDLLSSADVFASSLTRPEVSLEDAFLELVQQPDHADTGTVDEAIFLSRLRGGNVINLSMMRLPAHGEVSDEEYEALYLLADPVSELIKSHSEHDDFAVTHLIQPGIDHQIDLAFRTFGASLLSPREKAVLEMMLRGYSTDSSADKLGIALETVRRHRKSIYRKLDVSSQTDLFSLFLNAMSCLGEAGGEDPLSVYMSPR